MNRYQPSSTTTSRADLVVDLNDVTKGEGARRGGESVKEDRSVGRSAYLIEANGIVRRCPRTVVTNTARFGTLTMTLAAAAVVALHARTKMPSGGGGGDEFWRINCSITAVLCDRSGQGVCIGEESRVRFFAPSY